MGERDTHILLPLLKFSGEIIMRTFFTSLVSLSLVLAVTAVAQANLIVNGSFENPVQPPSPGYQNYTTSGQFDAVNWPLSGSMVIANGIFGTVASDGNQWLSLESLSSNPNIASITQTVSTPLGFYYELKFDYSVLMHSSQTEWNFSYDVNGTTITKNLTTGTTTTTLTPWTTETYTFVPTTPITTITFTGEQKVNGFYGPAIDNVILLNVGEVPPPAPEPATGLLLGLGACGLIARRKRVRKSISHASC
jgi:hypothetical protein